MSLSQRNCEAGEGCDGLDGSFENGIGFSVDGAVIAGVTLPPEGVTGVHLRLRLQQGVASATCSLDGRTWEELSTAPVPGEVSLVGIFTQAFHSSNTAVFHWYSERPL